MLRGAHYFLVATLLAMTASAQRARHVDEDEAGHREPPLSETAPSDEEARGLFMAGQAAFRDQRWDDAMRYFQQAFDLSPRPELLYNVGVAADRLRRDQEALAAFERFLELGNADDPHIPDARARVEILRDAIARHEVRPPPVVANSGGDPTAAWISFGVSSAVLAAGVVLLVLGQLDAQSVEGAMPGIPWTTVADAASRADLFRNVGWIMMISGAALATATLVWAIVEGGRGPSPSARLEVSPFGVRLRGVF
jgi:tetratricopeptide (TPR) repeat protein